MTQWPSVKTKEEGRTGKSGLSGKSGFWVQGGARLATKKYEACGTRDDIGRDSV
jgi:hypothetical protein